MVVITVRAPERTPMICKGRRGRPYGYLAVFALVDRYFNRRVLIRSISFITVRVDHNGLRALSNSLFANKKRID